MQSRTKKASPERSEGSLLLTGHAQRFADTNRRRRCLYVSRRERHGRKPQSRLSRPFKIRIVIDALRRVGFLFVALILVGAIFYYLTRAVQSSTAHVTRDDSPIHTAQ